MHEEVGRQLMLAAGISPRRARFAATHASWASPGTGIEDLMVSVAGQDLGEQAVPELEDLFVARVAHTSGREVWEDFIILDGLLETSAARPTNGGSCAPGQVTAQGGDGTG